MANYNKVLLIGNLTRDPQLRYTPSQMAVCEFGLAVNRKSRSSSGEQREEVCFVDITAWGKQAETLAKYVTKGRQLFVEGRLTFDQWEAQDGQKRSKLKVTLEGFQFLDSGRGGPGGAAGGSGPASEKVPGTTGSAPASESGEFNQEQPEDDTIPF